MTVGRPTKLTPKLQADGSRGVRLLTDIRAIFDDLNVDKLSSASLAKHLADLEESPWGDLRGKAIDARELARRIRPFDVRPHTVRIADHTPKGYERADFNDAWERYLPIPQIDRNTATSSETATERPLRTNDVADVADVAVFQEGDGMLRMPDGRRRPDLNGGEAVSLPGSHVRQVGEGLEEFVP